MSFQPNVPPSVLAKAAKETEVVEDDTGEEKTKKREDYKKLKELEEARKAGTAPAMKDEEGKDINPHIPQYIMQAPWYFGANTPTLRHQRQQEDKIRTFDGMEKWYKKGVKEGPVATKYRKGACENCGSMTHKKKDCLERPRKLGAKYTGSDIAPDEYIQSNLDLDYEGKRDRWNGYDINEHKRIFEEYQKLDEAKKLLKGQKLDNEGIEDEQEKEEEADPDKDDEDKYAEDMEMPGQKFETKQRITVRNLRIREDTAKYLYNLDVNSAYYDPKTRSMRENPFPGKDPNEIPFAGDNFVRASGDAMQIAQSQMFAWQAYEKGAEVHLQADPTKLAALQKEHKVRKEDFKDKAKDSILEKYGGEEHLEAPPKQLLLAQTEDYVEYSRHGTVIKGQEKAKVKSRYEEDVYLNNHTSVWGSFWQDGQWGFKCCHSTIKESYCTGNAGIEAAQDNILTGAPASSSSGIQKIPPMAIEDKSNEDLEHLDESRDQASVDEERLAILEMIEKQRQKVEEAEKKRKKKKEKKKKKKKDKKRKKKKKKKDSSSESSSSSSSESEDEEAAKEKKIKEAIEAEKRRVKQVDKLLAMDERKRPYNSMYDAVEPTEEELEAFKRTRKNYDDPMADFL